jgi:hypothetical protein
MADIINCISDLPSDYATNKEEIADLQTDNNDSIYNFE